MRFLPPLLILLTASCVRAQQELSLDEAIQLGLANNFDIRLARADLDVARNNDDYALTGKPPVISLGLSPGVSYRNTSNPASIVASSSILTYNVSPTSNLNWTLFNGGRVEISKERLGQLAELSEAQLQLQVENSIAGIVAAYYGAVVQQEQLGVLERVLGLSRDRIEYQRVRAEFGQAGLFNELQARDAYLSDSTNLVLQRANYRVALTNLLQRMGAEDLGPAIELTTPLRIDETPPDPAALEQELLAANPQLRVLRLNETLAATNTRLIETEYKPLVGLNLGGSYDISVATGTQTFDFGGDQPSREQELPGVAARTLAGQLGLSASYVLFDGGNRDVRTQTARLQEITSRLETDAATQQLRTALQNALTQYRNQVEVVAITERLIENAERNIAIAEERFRGGTINSFDYRAIQLSLVNAEFQLLNARLAVKNTETEIARLTGGVVD